MMVFIHRYAAILLRLKQLLLFLFIAFKCFYSDAEDFAIDFKQSYFVDTSSKLSINEVEKQTFTPYKNTLQLGFQPGEVWVKIEITDAKAGNGKHINEDRILILSPFILEQISLFENQETTWLVQSGGSRFVSENSICPYGIHCFKLSSDNNDQPQTIYLKIKHTGYITVKSEIATLSALSKITAAHTESITFSQAIAFSLLCVTLGLLFIDRSHFLLTYCLLQLSIFLYIFFASGKIFDLFPFLPNKDYSLINYEFINLRILLTVLLSYSLMKDYRIDKIYKWTALSLIGVCAVNFMVIAAGFTVTGIYIYMTVVALNIPIQFYGLSKADNIPISITRLLKFSYFVMAAILSYAYINIFRGNDALTVKGAEFIFYTNYRLNGTVFGVVVFLILIFKYYEKLILNVIRDKDLQLANETSRINNEKLQERQTLIDILTHELKSPLSTLKFAAYSFKNASVSDEDAALRHKRINSSLQRMDQLINHVANSNKVDRFSIETKYDFIHALSLVMQIIEDQIDGRYEINNRFLIDIDTAVNYYSNLHLLTLIFENLISNALKYATPHTLIKIQIHDNSTHTVFSITNHFPLQAKPDQNKLFQRYYRHDSFQPLPGVGIGLTLIKDAAEKANSTIDFDLTDDQISFRLSVPKCPS